MTKIRHALIGAAVLAAGWTLGAAMPAAAFGVLTVTEGPDGWVGDIPTSSPGITVGFDGERSFDPFGAGYDTSDGIVLNANWAPDPAYAKSFAKGLWTQLPGTFTWVLPSCNRSGCENANIYEPRAKWYYVPGDGWNDGTLSIRALDADGSFSDFVRVANDGPTGGATILFQSGVPEPASWALLLIGFGAVGYTARRARYRMTAVAS